MASISRLTRLVNAAKQHTTKPPNHWESSVEIAVEFCSVNGIDLPRLHNVDIPGGGRGEYRAHMNLVVVNAAVCRWSWWSKPGNKADVTTFGVTCHELAHHIQYQCMGGWKSGIRSWMSAGGHKSVTGYAKTNVGEQIAEAGRLFILNPQLLELLSPASFTYFKERVGLKHVQTSARGNKAVSKKAR